MDEKPSDKNTNLIWIDLEMTGLDPFSDYILELAVVPTDKQLNVLDEGLNIAVYQPPDILASMDDWCKENHGKSGLIERCQKSKMDIETTDKLCLEYIKKYVNEYKSPLCGNSVFQDRFFMTRFMPKSTNYLHYRLIDVSTFKELIARWYPDSKSFEKENKHMATEDIYESIRELEYYRKIYMKKI